MAYARFGPGSDVYVYVYYSIHGWYECADCGKFPTVDAIIAHLEEHIAKGDLVPEGVIEDIQGSLGML